MDIVKDAEKYVGLYVAISSFASKEVVTFGEDPIDVHNRAKAQGVKEPVVIYIPDPNFLQIFQAA